jgi:hypothetical protein
VTEQGAGPPTFGVPEHSALTVEGRVERAAGVARRAIRFGQGRERQLYKSNWAPGLLLVLGVFGLLILVMVVLYLVG